MRDVIQHLQEAFKGKISLLNLARSQPTDPDQRRFNIYSDSRITVYRYIGNISKII